MQSNTFFADPERVDGYAGLPSRFFSRIDPVPVAAPRLFALNRPLAETLGLNVADANENELAALFAGNAVVEGSTPLAMAYAGHQFGNFVPQLGDGRALLLGEALAPDGRVFEVQLKGSGPTPFSRGGDGRAALGPVIREYLVSEAMHALGIPTTRALAAVTTGESVYRDRSLPGAVLARVARSHVRVGTFEYFAVRSDHDGVGELVAFVNRRTGIDPGDRPALALLAAVTERQAALVAAWMSVGFIHGVMNTDNMAVSGETIDYGPCAFMEAFDPDAVWSSIDRGGRYAWSNQSRIAQWNLARLAETLLPLIDADRKSAIKAANEVLEAFPNAFECAWLERMRAKLGLTEARDGDPELLQDLLDAMHAGGADFTLTFRFLADVIDPDAEDSSLHELFSDSEQLNAWLETWRARLASEGRAAATVVTELGATNPALIPRNHRVEQAIRAAEDRGDFTLFDRLRSAWLRPFDPAPEDADLTRPAEPQERVIQTFCGT